MEEKEEEKGLEKLERYSGHIGSLAILVASLAVWFWGLFLRGNPLVAIIGAGVAGGMLYDIVLNKGKYVLPNVEEDGIALGSLYGAIVGFATAILVVDGILSASSEATDFQLPIQKSLTTFLVALGLKGGSEVAATARISLLKRRSFISYDAGGFKYRKGDTITVGGKLVLPDAKKLDETPQDKVVHINLKKAGVETSREVLTRENGQFEYPLKSIDEGEWESWASWEGDDKYDKAESEHQLFRVESE